jgi:AAHS family 4-hydroxybenzoate transporter-like MFS transporter
LGISQAVETTDICRNNKVTREESEMSASPIDVSRLTGEGKLTRFHLRLLLLTSLLTLLDGYDITAISFAAPELAKAWGIADRSAFAPVFAASLVGMLIGAPALGWAGDRFGRKPAIIFSCLVFGVFTLAMMWASSLEQMMALRFITGIGMGGLLPNAAALNAEYAPGRHRATMIILMYVGTALGGAIPGPIAATLAPAYGWQVLFLIGGALPIIGAIAAWLWLPESVKYLVLKGGRNEEVAQLVNRLDTKVRASAADTFLVGGSERTSSASVGMLFRGGLRTATPLLWLLFVANLMGYFFLLSWTPLLLVGSNIPIAKAAIALSVFQIGGIVGGLSIARPMDWWGLGPVIGFFVLAVPVIGSIGIVGSSGSELLLLLIVFLGGFFTLGIQLGLNAVCAMIYPTNVRSLGAGWALGVGRVGSIVGPLVGGILVSANLPIQTLYLYGALPFAVGALGAIGLGLVSKRRFGGRLLADADTVRGGPAPARAS